jgi:hypothetical protein
MNFSEMIKITAIVVIAAMVAGLTVFSMPVLQKG